MVTHAFVPFEDIQQRKFDRIKNADRVTLVDSNGNVVSTENPLPTSSTISLSGVSISVDAVGIKDRATNDKVSVNPTGTTSPSTTDGILLTQSRDFFIEDSLVINRNSDGSIASAETTYGTNTRKETINRNADGSIQSITVEVI